MRHGKADWKHTKNYSTGVSVDEDRWEQIFGKKKNDVSGIYEYNKDTGGTVRVVESTSIADFDKYYNKQVRSTSAFTGAPLVIMHK